MRQPVLHHARSSAASRAAYGFVCFVIAMLWLLALALGFVALILLWIPAAILAVIAIPIGIVLFLRNPRRNMDKFRNWFERESENALDSVSHVSTSATLLAERHAERDGGGFFLTMAPGRFEAGKRQPALLTLRDDRHVTLICGSRGGKGRAIILPNLARWQGSAIVFDPAGELIGISAAHRRDVLGQDIHVLDPFSVTAMSSSRWNPFDEIDENDPLLVEKVRLISESLVEPTGGDRYWTDAARSMLTGVILHVLTAAQPEARNLYTVRQLLTDQSPDAVWAAMLKNDALNGLVRQHGQENASREIKEVMGVLQSARVATEWLDSPAIQTVIASSSFSMIDFKRDRATLYLVLPAGQGEAFSKWLRLIFNMAFDAMQDIRVPKPADEVLFVLDEFPLLGQMERIKRAAGEAAKFGVKLFIVAQNVMQLKEHYGEMWETFISNAFLLITYANNDLATLDYVSARIGKGWFQKTVHTTSTGEKPSTSIAHSQELQDIARPNEIGRGASRESGEAFFFVAGMKPWRLRRANYDQWPFYATPTAALRPGCPPMARLLAEMRHEQ